MSSTVMVTEAREERDCLGLWSVARTLMLYDDCCSLSRGRSRMMTPEELSMEKTPLAESSREYTTFLLMPVRSDTRMTAQEHSTKILPFLDL